MKKAEVATQAARDAAERATRAEAERGAEMATSLRPGQCRNHRAGREPESREGSAICPPVTTQAKDSVEMW